LVIAVIVALCFLNYRLSKQVSKYQKLIDKLSEIDYLIEKNAIKPFDYDMAFDNAIAGYMSSLDDAYSAYFIPDNYDTYLESNQGTFTGIGVQIYATEQILTKGILVSRPVGNSPAEEAGIKANDLIVAVDGESIIGRDYDEAIDRVLGEPGTIVTLTVLRGDEELQFSIERRTFVQREVDYRIINGNIGYVQIHNFNANAYAELSYALTDLSKYGVEGIIFDVRNNPGGLINTVINMVDLLVDKDELVVVQYKNDERVYYSTDGKLVDVPMVVLINDASVSASELFASALRDISNVPLIGETTYGKGVGQTSYRLSDGYGIKITTFNYVTKSRTNYDSIGLEPDITVPMTYEDKLVFYTLDETNDGQLSVAISELYSLINTTK
jgi:carboxyl-terminal processing protease